MRRTLLVARHEYLRFARRRAFLLGTIGFPLLLVLVAGVGVLSVLTSGQGSIGYVDRAGVLAPSVIDEGYVEELEAENVRAFADEEAGREALTDGVVEVLFVVPEAYLEDRSIVAYLPPDTERGVGTDARAAFASFIRASLAHTFASEASGLDVRASDITRLLVEGPAVSVRAGDRERGSGAEALVGFAVPFAAGMMFLIAAISSGGYLLQAVSDEKENRTVEILTTSVSSRQLIVGKTVGLVGVAGTQLAVWTGGAIIALVAVMQLVSFPAGVAIPWGALAGIVAFFIPAYLLLAGIMVSIGSVYPDYRQSQQIVAVVNMLFVAPFFFMALMIQNLDGALAVGLTFFPTTSLITVALRSAAGAMPVEQVVISWLILATSAGAAVMVAPRIFRAGMLGYGRRLEPRSTLKTLRPGGRQK